VIEVASPLTREQFVALQLSHNAVVGEDDPNLLRSLYDELAFEWKEYSGLTDDAFKVEDLDTTVLRVEAPFYQELHVSFLPADAGVFNDWLGKIGKAKTEASRDQRASGTMRLVGEVCDFDLFFDTLLAVKAATGVHNTAVALRAMAELAGRALAAEASAADDAAAGAGDAGG